MIQEAQMLSPAATRWLPVMRDRIVDAFHPQRIILFGSEARGEAGPDSDIDLLVVLDKIDDARTARVAIRMVLSDLPVGKDVFVTTEGSIKEWGDVVGTILRPALREGVTIYERV